MLTAEATYDALLHGKGIQNADVAVVSIDSQTSELSGPTTIPNISNYHFFQFLSDHMMMWRYFQIGKGKRWKYTGVTFHSFVEIIKFYSSTFANYAALTTKKPRVDGSVNILKFSPQLGCTESFTDEASLAEHMLLGRHTSQPIPKTMMDKARLTYGNKMKCSNPNSTHHQLLSSSISSKTEGFGNFIKLLDGHCQREKCSVISQSRRDCWWRYSWLGKCVERKWASNKFTSSCIPSWSQVNM